MATKLSPDSSPARHPLHQAALDADDAFSEALYRKHGKAATTNNIRYRLDQHDEELLALGAAKQKADTAWLNYLRGFPALPQAEQEQQESARDDQEPIEQPEPLPSLTELKRMLRLPIHAPQTHTPAHGLGGYAGKSHRAPESVEYDYASVAAVDWYAGEED